MGNFTNCIRYFPTQALNFAFKPEFKKMFKPKKTDSYLAFTGKNIASGGCAGFCSLCFVFSLDYARTRLSADSKSAGKEEANANSPVLPMSTRKLSPLTVLRDFTEDSFFPPLVSSST